MVSRGGRGPITPPHVGMSLGWRLALYTSLVVTLVMGAVTFLEEVNESRQERLEIEESLRSSLVPLAADIEQAVDLAQIESEILTFHHAYVDVGSADHQLLLTDDGGRLIYSTIPPSEHPDLKQYHQADLPVSSTVFHSGRSRLTVLKNNSAYRDHQRSRWNSWALHLGVTLASILIVLQITIRYFVTAPLERLLEAIRKMEMGYWGEAENIGGAWEIRWINWRFNNMGRELQKTVHRLLDAERRARSITPHTEGLPMLVANSAQSISPEDSERQSPVQSEQLQKYCRVLEAVGHPTQRDRDLALETLDNHALSAERLGDMSLKSRLENAAFRVLEPVLYRDLEARVNDVKKTRGAWLDQCRDDLERALVKKRAPVQSLQCRYKHTAGVWKKMLAKGLRFDQVHDLFAVRVIVPTESDCYWALGVAHDVFEPVVGRFKDYIAEPKPNGYKSIHTCVRAPDGQVLEIQIRSIAMHQSAEFGATSHLRYKMNSPEAIVEGGKTRRWWRVLRLG